MPYAVSPRLPTMYGVRKRFTKTLTANEPHEVLMLSTDLGLEEAPLARVGDGGLKSATQTEWRSVRASSLG